jgi:hypothetical protein
LSTPRPKYRRQSTTHTNCQPRSEDSLPEQSVPIAAGVLYPVFGLLLSPMLASAALSFSSVSVIANALRWARVRI